MDPPEGGQNGENQSSDEGENKTFDVGSFTDPGADGPWNVTVDWGDGSQNTTFDSASPGNLPQKPHTYADDGSYTVTVTVAEASQNAPSDSGTFTVTVANVRPTVALIGPNTADEGDTKTYNFTVTDPGTADTHTIDRSCGANGEKVGGSFSYDPATKTGSFECRFPDGPAQTNVSVTVNDGDGSGSDSITVNVANVAPTANDDQMNTTELQEVAANLPDNDSDPGNDLDAASLRIPSASGPNDGGATIGDLLDGNVTYTPDRGFVGADSFRYEICDDDGDCSSANVQVTVGPVDCNAQGVIRGTQRADVLRGTAGNDIICAFAGKDTIYGGGGDLLIGDSGDDRVWGQDGSDVMRGGANTDAMDGGLGDDYMSGDSGRDVMLGRGGIDFIGLLDGSAGDAGNGGAGTDTCAKDSGDRTVSCERRQ